MIICIGCKLRNSTKCKIKLLLFIYPDTRIFRLEHSCMILIKLCILCRARVAPFILIIHLDIHIAIIRILRWKWKYILKLLNNIFYKSIHNESIQSCWYVFPEKWSSVICWQLYNECDNWIYGTKDDGTRDRKYAMWWW